MDNNQSFRVRVKSSHTYSSTRIVSTVRKTDLKIVCVDREISLRKETARVYPALQCDLIETTKLNLKQYGVLSRDVSAVVELVTVGEKSIAVVDMPRIAEVCRLFGLSLLCIKLRSLWKLAQNKKIPLRLLDDIADALDENDDERDFPGEAASE